MKPLLNRVNRLEFIDETGRVLVRYINTETDEFRVSIQDNGKTVKIFQERRYANWNREQT